MAKLSSLRIWITKGIAAFLKRLQNQNTDPLDIYFAYRLFLERHPEPRAWRNWGARTERGMTLGFLRTAFLTSAEYRSQHDRLWVGTEHFRIYVDPEDMSVGGPISSHKQYEPHLTTFLKRELRSDMHFLDIGANMGWFTLLAASLLPEGRVMAVEPNVYNVQLLNQSVLGNQFKHVTVYPFAATDAAAMLALSFVGSNGRIAQTEHSTPDMQFVQGLPLDQLLPPGTRVDVIKIDIEGFEWVAFKGMTRLLQDNHPLIVTEFHPQAIREYTGYEPEKYLQTLFELGYDLGVLMPDGQVQAMADKEAIMAHWQLANKQAGHSGELHLDLVARPTNHPLTPGLTRRLHPTNPM